MSEYDFVIWALALAVLWWIWPKPPHPGYAVTGRTARLGDMPA